MNSRKVLTRIGVLLLTLLVIAVMLPNGAANSTIATANSKLSVSTQTEPRQSIVLRMSDNDESNLCVSVARTWQTIESPPKIVKVGPDGSIASFPIDSEKSCGSSSTGLATSSCYGRGSYEVGYLDIAVNQEGNVYVANVDRVDVYTPEGTKIDSISVGLGVTSMAFDTSGNLFVSVALTSQVVKISPTGAVSSFPIDSSNTCLGTSSCYGRGSYAVGYLDLAVNQEGNLYVANVDRVDVYTPEGTKIDSISVGLGVTSVAFDTSGNLFVSKARVVQVVDEEIVVESPPKIVKIGPDGSTVSFLVDSEQNCGWQSTGLGTAFCHDGRSYEVGYLDIAVNQEGNLYVANVDRVDVYTPEGAKIDSISVGLGVTDLTWGSMPAHHIEVTQAIQDENNSVPLIENKATFVRVYVDCGPDCTRQPDVTGVLRGYGPSGELPDSPLPSINKSMTAYHEDWRNQRGDLSKTLNFTLPEIWRTGTITLTAEVNMSGNSVTRSETVTFQPARTPSILYVPITYQGRSPELSRIYFGFWWAQRVYPTAKILYDPGPTLQWKCPKESDWCPPTILTGSAELLLNELTTHLRLVNKDVDYMDYIYGWLPEGAYGGPDDYGDSDPAWLPHELFPTARGAGKAAFGEDDPAHGQRVFAHEIGHLLGRQHTRIPGSQQRTCEDPDWPYSQLRPQDYDWPYPTAKIQEWGVEESGFLHLSPSGVKDPSETYDYMSLCGTWHNLPEWTSPYTSEWTSPHTYEHIYTETLGTHITALAAQPLSIPQPYFIASGLVYTDDTAILDPIWVITSTVTPENPPAGTQYCLEAQNASSMPLTSHCFDSAFMNYESGEETNVDGFNLMPPYPSGVARIVLKKGAAELAVRTVSANAPVVTVLSPNGGETWAASGTYTITWSASDADDDPLTYRVLYSPNGANWLPVGGAIAETQLAVNAGELAGGSNARIQVLATDGVNTMSDESDSVFTVGRKPPLAYILSLEDDATISPGTPLWLQGYAYDLEDGVLGESTLQWSSSRDGTLGTGSEALVTLSSGQHVITFRAQDSDGDIGQAQIGVYVGYKVFLPLMLKNR